jgi:hypothetical protein
MHNAKVKARSSIVTQSTSSLRPKFVSRSVGIINLSKQSNWSRVVPKSRSAPKGGRDALERAKMQLAPFDQHKSSYSPYLCLCEECIESRIIDLAIGYNSQKLLIENAPRVKEVLKNLERISTVATDLADALVGMDNVSREYLWEISEPDVNQGIINPHQAAAVVLQLPRPKTEREPASDGPLVESLQALAQQAKSRSRELPGLNGRSNVVDKGGNTNIIKREIGSPAAHLVQWSWYVFEECRPGTATASDNGPLVAFVNFVHEYATGVPDENSTVLHWVKKLAKHLRSCDLGIQELSKLEAELKDRSVDPNQVGADSIAELEAKIEQARDEVVKTLMLVERLVRGSKERTSGNSTKSLT